MGGGPLTGHELDDLRNWALGAREDDPGDEFPPLLLRLLGENAELRELLYRAEQGGELKVISDLNAQIDQLKAAVSVARESERRLDQEVRRQKTEITELKRQIEVSAAIMYKVEKLMQMARENVTEGTGTSIETLDRLAVAMERDYLRSKKEHEASVNPDRVRAEAKSGG